MYIKKKWVPAIVFVSIALICGFLSIFLPWWSVGTSPEAEVLTNVGVRTEYRLLKTVLLYKRTGNDVFSLYLYLNMVNVTSNQDIFNEIYSVFDMTMWLQVSGIVVGAVVFVLAIVIDRKKLKTLWVIGMLISATLVLAAPLYFMYNFVPSISKLDQFTPVTLPEEYIPIKPANVSTFFGNMTIPKASTYPSWAQGQPFWIWGATSGFFLALTASFMLFASTVIVNFALTERRKFALS